MGAWLASGRQVEEEGDKKISTVYLICGNTASGKSTYSLNLAEQIGAVYFSIDPWMQTLYGSDYDPQTHDFAWLTERTQRCKKLIREVSEPILKNGISVILEIGFGDFDFREYYRKWALGIGADVSVHYLDIPVKERRRRVKKRNEEKGSTYAFEVTDEMFDYVEPMFVPPDEDELVNGKRITEYYT